MTTCKILDAPGGDTVTLHVLGKNKDIKVAHFGMTPTEHQQVIDSLPDLECRDDDILLSGYGKCGTHWLFEVLHMVQTNTLEVAENFKSTGMFECARMGEIDKLPSPRILNTHLRPEYLPKDILRKKVKCVFVYRNPKDVAVSFYHHTKGINLYEYEGKFENFVQMFMREDVECGAYTSYLQDWQEFIRGHPELPVHYVGFENLHKDCLGEFRRLCRFLNYDIDDDRLKKIVAECQIHNLKPAKMAKVSNNEMYNTIFKEDFFIYRKGKVGGWKEYFSEELNEQFDRWWNEGTKGFNLFDFTFEL